MQGASCVTGQEVNLECFLCYRTGSEFRVLPVLQDRKWIQSASCVTGQEVNLECFLCYRTGSEFIVQSWPNSPACITRWTHSGTVYSYILGCSFVCACVNWVSWHSQIVPVSLSGLCSVHAYSPIMKSFSCFETFLAMPQTLQTVSRCQEASFCSSEPPCSFMLLLLSWRISWWASDWSRKEDLLERQKTKYHSSPVFWMETVLLLGRIFQCAIWRLVWACSLRSCILSVTT